MLEENVSQISEALEIFDFVDVLSVEFKLCDHQRLVDTVRVCVCV